MPDVASYRPRSWAILAEIALAAATIAIILQTSAWRTTYAGVSVMAAVADLSAGIGLLAAGTALVLTRLRPAVGVTAGLAGITWLAADWAGWQGGPALPRTLAMGIALSSCPWSSTCWRCNSVTQRGSSGRSCARHISSRRRSPWRSSCSGTPDGSPLLEQLHR